MKVKIRTKDIHFSMPVPLSMAGFVIKLLPDRLFEEMRAGLPEPYSTLITKETVTMTAMDCLDILKENKGLEVIHVEAQDGTFVSITL